MKKSNKKVGEASEETMQELAFEKSDDAKFEAENMRIAEWVDVIRQSMRLSRSKNGADVAEYARKGVFDDAVRYFKNRITDIKGHYYSNYSFGMTSLIVQILAFDFHYEYTEYAWSAKSLDTSDPAAFEEGETCDELDANQRKQEVCKQLTDFLLTGGAMAKSIHSDTYLEWRKLYMRLNYEYEWFAHGDHVEVVERFMRDIKSVARLTCADFAFEKRLNDLSQNTSEKGKKGPKKRGRGGIL